MCQTELAGRGPGEPRLCAVIPPWHEAMHSHQPKRRASSCQCLLACAQLMVDLLLLIAALADLEPCNSTGWSIHTGSMYLRHS
jgi:hypothetical protein